MKITLLLIALFLAIFFQYLFEERNPELINKYHITTQESPMSRAIYREGGEAIISRVVVSYAINGNLIGAIKIDPKELIDSGDSEGFPYIDENFCEYYILDTAIGNLDGPMDFLEFSSRDVFFNFQTLRIFEGLSCLKGYESQWNEKLR